MKKKILFTLLFVFSLSGILIASFKDWLILSMVIQVIWITITSNDIIRSARPKNGIHKMFQTFNKLFIYLFIADVVIIILSMSFGFRTLFAAYYQPIFYISVVCITISVFGNYYIIVDNLIKREDSQGNKFILVLSSLFYPIGAYLIKSRGQ